MKTRWAVPFFVVFVASIFVSTVWCGKSDSTVPPTPVSNPTPIQVVATCKTQLPHGTPPPAGSVQWNGVWYTCSDATGANVACPADISQLPACQ